MFLALSVRSLRRTAVGLASAGLLAVVALLPLTVLFAFGPSPASAATQTPAVSSPMTVTQKDPLRFAYLPATKKLSTEAPSVTVAQTTLLTNQVVHVTWKNFTPSRTLSGNPGYAPGSTLYAVGVYECKGVDPSTSPLADKNAGTVGDCYRYTVDDPANATAGQANAVKTFTAADGTGEADIQVETIIENTDLGCSSTSPCSIAVVPMFGGPVTSTFSATRCASHSLDTLPGNQSAIDLQIGDACSWADRLVVPLSFAPSPNACPAGDPAFNSGGSPMLNRAMAQWRPSWCQGSGSVKFGYDAGINEYEARTDFTTPGIALGGELDAAFTTQPATPDQTKLRAFTYAPVANTAIAIAFEIDDDAAGKEVTDLKLNARLVAKLITQSYALNYGGCAPTAAPSKTCDPSVSGNPPNILADPEFQKLNPGYKSWATQTSATLDLGSFLPTVIGGNSDLIYELTRWIASDPDAAAFLSGTPDPYGMHINTNYKDPGYPVSQLEELDPGYTDPAGLAGNGTMQVSWSLISGLTNVPKKLLGNLSTALDVSTVVDDGVTPPHYSNFAPEAVGTRALFAIMDAGEAQAFQFPTAQIENAAGDFVAPTAAGISAGISHSLPNADGITAQEDLAAKDANAYPLAVTDYAMVPTCSLKAPVASAVATMLTLAASTGQTAGDAPGQLAAGYVPLNSAQLAQTAKAVSAVRAQKICLAAPTAPTKPTAPTTPTTTTNTDTTTPIPDTSSDDTGGDQGGSTDTSTDVPTLPDNSSTTLLPKGGAPAPVVAAPEKTVASEGTHYGDAGAGPNALVPALVVGAALMLGGPAGWYLRRTRLSVVAAGGVPA